MTKLAPQIDPKSAISNPVNVGDYLAGYVAALDDITEIAGGDLPGWLASRICCRRHDLHIEVCAIKHNSRLGETGSPKPKLSTYNFLKCGAGLSHG